MHSLPILVLEKRVTMALVATADSKNCHIVNRPDRNSRMCHKHRRQPSEHLLASVLIATLLLRILPSHKLKSSMFASRFRRLISSRKLIAASTSRMSFHFASSEYAACFRGLPTANTDVLRARTLEYLDAFDPQTWYDKPVSHDGHGQSFLVGPTSLT